ncbi:hypothetical protein CRC_03045 [Cylindrospermopsis raciborskii CS-505]|nr:hypothetical protein CRC_03045 [Cylindrospermopsis raciborskii CS-505]
MGGIENGKSAFVNPTGYLTPLYQNRKRSLFFRNHVQAIAFLLSSSGIKHRMNVGWVEA